MQAIGVAHRLGGVLQPVQRRALSQQLESQPPDDRPAWFIGEYPSIGEESRRYVILPK
jgi:hypothetical protein